MRNKDDVKLARSFVVAKILWMYRVGKIEFIKWDKQKSQKVKINVFKTKQ